MIIYVLYFPETLQSNDYTKKARVKVFLKPKQACNFLLKEMHGIHGVDNKFTSLAILNTLKQDIREVVKLYNDSFSFNFEYVKLYEIDANK